MFKWRGPRRSWKKFSKNLSEIKSYTTEIDDIISRPQNKALQLANSTAFHYCSLNTFLSMVDTREFWLSDVNTMNDFSEGHWGYDRFIDAANEIIEEVGRDFIDEIDKFVSTMQFRHLPVIACFSRNGDVLSQWRAYSSDGAGVAVGFPMHKLMSLNCRVVVVDYNPQSQIDIFKDAISALFALKQRLSEAAFDKVFAYYASMIGMLLFSCKNPAFEEEQEIRLIRSLSVQRIQDNIKFSDVGGDNTDQLSGKPLDVLFRVSGSGIVPYIRMPFSGLGKDAIVDVVIGPKSSNGGNEVRALLNSKGFEHAKVRSSLATYR